MAITAKLNHAQVQYSTTGTMSLGATIELTDDTLGALGVRRIDITDETVTSAVAQYIEQMLPSLSAAAGVSVTLPTAPPSDITPVE